MNFILESSLEKEIIVILFYCTRSLPEFFQFKCKWKRERVEYSKIFKFGENYFYKEVAEWLKAIDCKSIELCSTLVRIQPSLF